ncbi:Tfp pilus assembly protein FimT/FimU [Acinetobacter sichuanensis]|uniref:Prepilin-type N-terminal cleavage/methylation domain-containing protein n=1 Tax=Acinetobacter sichuanensis TaxID=2136183 RepID=A0A371YVA2_9GAMM|nr:prepilin-type N-terminal cleavage/methylation domain-containing protein [Acinetobacter sichuanensis]RFC85334.1 prepilin-type N-terminal cleavage/methylation domain-containing protein [Acinetobacter sichuanensis]
MQLMRGFTLIELMVTISVIAIIAMMAIPPFKNMLTQQDLKKNTNELIGVLNQARAKAALERKNVEVELSPSEVDLLPQNTDTTIYWMPYGKVHLTTASETKITYGLNGSVRDAGSDTTFIICSEIGGKSQIVKVSKMGTIQQAIQGAC